MSKNTIDKYTLLPSTQLYENYDEVVDPATLCKMLHVGKNTIYHLLATKEIPSIYIGRKIKIRKIDVIQFWNNHLR